MSLTKVTQSMLVDGYISVRDYGAKGNGSTDDTAAIQSAINAAIASGKTLLIPMTDAGGTYVVSQGGNLPPAYCLLLGSDLNIFLEPGVTIQAAAGLGLYVTMIMCPSKSNVHISGYGATVAGTGDYSYLDSEFRHGFWFSGCSNIVVEGLTVKDTGGDGIYLGTTNNNVVLRDVTCDNVVRNGVTIIGGKNITLDRCRLLNAKPGTTGDGLDIEPDAATEYLQNIVIKECYSHNNATIGFHCNPHAIDGSTKQTIDVTFVDCVSDQDLGSGFGASGLNPTYLTSVTGKVLFQNCTTITSGQSGFTFRGWGAGSAAVLVEDCTVVDPALGGVPADRYGAPFSVWNESGDASLTQGNVHIIRPQIQYTVIPPNIPDFYFRAGNGTVTNCSVVDPISIGHPGVSGQQYQGNFEGTDFLVSDPNELMTHEGTQTVYSYYFGSTYKNSGPASAVFTLTAVQAGYPDIYFESTNTAGLRIVPDASSAISPLAAVGKYIETNQLGANITLRRVSATQWMVVNVVGTWTAEV